MDEAEALKKARDMVLRLLSYRARSRKELKDYLEKKGFSANLSHRILSEMEKYNYVNDEKFAEDYITSQKTKGYGFKKIRHELFLKGIKEEVIEQKVSELLDPEEDFERAKALIRRRFKKSGFAATSEIDDNKQRWFRREASFLQRRGFQDDLIIKVLKNFNLSNDY